MAFLEKLRGQKEIHGFLVKAGVRGIYRAIRTFFLRLIYGSSKKIKIGPDTFLFSIRSDEARKFFNNRYWFGELFEKEVTLHFIERLKRARCFLDVGACLGFYTVIAAKLSAPSGGSAHAIEMDAANLRHLSESVSLNRLENVRVYQAAAGDKNGVVSYFQCGTEIHTLDPSLAAAGRYEKMEVPMVTLDAFTEKHSLDPDVIKIDVEGAEFNVLRGMEALLKKPGLKLYIEVHLHEGRGSLGAFGHKIEDVTGLLRRNGFTMEILPLRQDSKIAPGILKDESQLTESVMLYCSK